MSDNKNAGVGRSGWFADVDDDSVDAVRGMWQPCIASRSGIYSSLGIWFNTELECQKFIRDEIIGIGFYPGEEPENADEGN